MKILFDIGHPAHVHLFRNFIKYLQSNDHYVYIVSRNKDLTNILMNHYELKHHSISSVSSGIISMLWELLSRTGKIFKLNLKKKFDFAFGTSVSIGFLSLFFSGVKSYNFNEDDDDYIILYSLLAYPFATKIINPDCLRYKRWKERRKHYPSYHELAYLHPDNFKANPDILKKYKLNPQEYIIIRHSALKAHHDLGAKGIDNKIWSRIYEIVKDYPLIYSTENEKSHQIDPWDMHHIMAFAKMLITDSQSMSMEASVLGIPNIRYNSFAGRISVLEELEHKYALTCGFRPGNEDALVNKLKELLNNKNLHNEWQSRKEKMLSEKVDFNQWMINFFEKEINV